MLPLHLQIPLVVRAVEGVVVYEQNVPLVLEVYVAVSCQI